MPTPPTDSDAKGLTNAGTLSTLGAVAAALLASACCWLPLASIGLGGSAIGVAGFFEAYRGLFLGITAAFLAAGFYHVYFRKPACNPGDACAVPNTKLQRANKIGLWVATGFVVVFASFPNYVGALMGDVGASAALIVCSHLSRPDNPTSGSEFELPFSVVRSADSDHSSCRRDGARRSEMVTNPAGAARPPAPECP